MDQYKFSVDHQVNNGEDPAEVQSDLPRSMRDLIGRVSREEFRDANKRFPKLPIPKVWRILVLLLLTSLKSIRIAQKSHYLKQHVLIPQPINDY